MQHAEHGAVIAIMVIDKFTYMDIYLAFSSIIGSNPAFIFLIDKFADVICKIGRKYLNLL